MKELELIDRKELDRIMKGLKNGLYRVKTSYLCAGFVVRDKKIIMCAPILRMHIRYWATLATWIAE
jgi:hypothetical protein